MFEWIFEIFKKKEPEDIQCPVCGYYCVGNGGHGCISKQEMIKKNLEGYCFRCASYHPKDQQCLMRRS